MRMLDELFLLSAIHHIDTELFEDHIQYDNRYDDEPEPVPTGEEAAFRFSLIGHSSRLGVKY